MTKDKSPIYIKSFDFALLIILFYKSLVEQREYIISKQLLRSGTAIGALVREGYHGESRTDFIHKMSIALKEANETRYWIDLITKGNLVPAESSLLSKSSSGIDELIRMLAAIVKTSKLNSK